MKREIPTGPIGYRLAHELEGLLVGISADGIIDQEEADRLKRWRNANSQFSTIKPFSELCEKVDQALADGKLTLDECRDLIFVAQKLTTVNPYFDAIRSGIQVLTGLLAGLTTDRNVNDAEAKALIQWTQEWNHLRGLWPYDECEAIVASALSDHRRAGDLEYLVSLSEQFPVAGDVLPTGEIPPLVIRGVCAVDPDIEFPDRVFVLTGESERCQRADLEARIQLRDGLTESGVTRRTNYLVVCDGGNQHWAFACYGRKVEYAYNLRRDGFPIAIVHEADLWDALEG